MKNTLKWRRWGAAAAVALVAFVPACGLDEDENGGTTEALDEGDFILVFEEIPEDYAEVDQRFRDYGFEQIVDELNDWIALPDDITIRAGTIEGMYFHFDPNVNEIVIGYDMLDLDRQALVDYGFDEEEAWEEMLSANHFFLYHEVGHALVENLELPVTGREEDAVDGFAAFLMVDRLEAGRDLVLSAVNLSDAQAEFRGEELDEDVLADEHSLDEQRSYQYLCWIYGSDPEGYEWILEEEYLPAQRAEGCPFEYEQNMTSWYTLLGDHYKPAEEG